MTGQKKKKFEIFPREYGIIPYIFLIYVSFPIYSLYFENGWPQVLGFGLLFLFLAAYRQLYFTFGTKKFHSWLAAQISVVFILSVFFHSSYIFMGFFPANFISWYKDDKQKFYFSLGYLSVSVIIPLFVHYESIYTKEILYILPFVIMIIISPLAFRSFNGRLELERKLKEANDQIKELVKEEERIRIARDLHDTLGHTLSLITLKSQLISKLALKDPERASLEAREMEITSRAALAQVRELVSDMKSLQIEDELKRAASILEAASISYEQMGPRQLKNISSVTQNILCMSLREAITNVVKHSKATKCSIRLEQFAGKVMMTVKDNGMGIGGNYVNGNGLVGIEERLQMIDGSFSITNGNGTELVISVPVISRDIEEGALFDKDCDSGRSTNASGGAKFPS